MNRMVIYWANSEWRIANGQEYSIPIGHSLLAIRA
jgi:hypothetical protein